MFVEPFTGQNVLTVSVFVILVTNLCKLVCFQVKQRKKVGKNCLEVDTQTDMKQNTIYMKILNNKS